MFVTLGGVPKKPSRLDREFQSQSSPNDGRSPAQHDRDRLLYSSAFRRLAEVTQVVTANSGYVFHNRLTHSLQVAQVGRRMAENLIRQYDKHLDISKHLDPDVVEAAALAHDLGHPPFGHVIEETIFLKAYSDGTNP
ncbi:HD domain-containing protein [Terriglobus sp. YAF25]|uniref:HD domain-containing protein n=1 Tax=Terriglobus sp. YAF25 TaxID=3233080 RepID=UPI003F9E3B9F